MSFGGLVMNLRELFSSYRVKSLPLFFSSITIP